MVVNNFELIESLLEFNSNDDFYFLQILRRKKENLEQTGNSRVIDTYRITSREHLNQLKQEIIDKCEYHNARAYINLNKRSFEKIAFHALKKVTDCIMNKSFKDVRNAYDSVCGKFSDTEDVLNLGTSGGKYWVVDIDTKDSLFIDAVVHEICKCQSPQEQDENGYYKNIYAFIPTLNGWHIITTPFNLRQIEPFRCKYPFDIQKNNPTLLYLKSNK